MLTGIAVLEGLEDLLELSAAVLHDELEEELLLLSVLLVHALDVPLEVELADLQRLLHVLDLTDQGVHGRLLLLVQELQLLLVHVDVQQDREKGGQASTRCLYRVHFQPKFFNIRRVKVNEIGFNVRNLSFNEVIPAL